LFQDGLPNADAFRLGGEQQRFLGDFFIHVVVSMGCMACYFPSDIKIGNLFTFISGAYERLSSRDFNWKAGVGALVATD
ncbi:hypothetical protein, partial [Rhizobium leguminosarum]|uniref:hypothetical protein n=1 Tax=Rhizobium leguminosarum TaxID=384 RepID=UPI003F9AC1E9